MIYVGVDSDPGEAASSPGGCAGMGWSEVEGECEGQQSHPESQRG